MITKELLTEIGKKKGLANKEHIEKDYFQDLLLFHLYKQTNLLIFKGGTALYKLYNLPRFSEDIDFSILKQFDAEIIYRAVNNIEGAEAKEIKTTKGSLLTKISFKGILTRYNTVRIDISLNNPTIEDFDVRTYISSYVDINPFSIRAMNIKEVLAEKIHALLTRQKARDLYDLFFLLRLTTPEKRIIAQKLRSLGVVFTHRKLEEQIANLEHVWRKELRSFVLTELPEFSAVSDFVRQNLRNLRL